MVASDEAINTSGMIASIATVPSNVVSFAANTLFSAISLFAGDATVPADGKDATKDLEKKKLSESDSG